MPDADVEDDANVPVALPLLPTDKNGEEAAEVDTPSAEPRVADRSGVGPGYAYDIAGADGVEGVGWGVKNPPLLVLLIVACRREGPCETYTARC